MNKLRRRKQRHRRRRMERGDPMVSFEDPDGRYIIADSTRMEILRKIGLNADANVKHINAGDKRLN